MADNRGSTISKEEDDISKGRVSKPIPILCQSRMLPNRVGWCERNADVIATERDIRASLILKEVQKKGNVTVELTNRILEWNDMKCTECHASLKGKGPQVLDEHEVKVCENRDLSDDDSEPATQTKDTEDSDPYDEDPRKKRHSWGPDGLQFPMDDV